MTTQPLSALTMLLSRHTRRNSPSVRAPCRVWNVDFPWRGASRARRREQAAWSERVGSGPSSLNIHHCGLYGGRSRPSFRPVMYRRERGRDRCRPAGRNPWRVFVLEVEPSRGYPSRARKGRPYLVLDRENGPSRYLHTAANEPRGHLARLNGDGVARGGMMLILKYFLVVGGGVQLGLIGVTAPRLRRGSARPAAFHNTPNM